MEIISSINGVFVLLALFYLFLGLCVSGEVVFSDISVGSIRPQVILKGLFFLPTTLMYLIVYIFVVVLSYILTKLESVN